MDQKTAKKAFGAAIQTHIDRLNVSRDEFCFRYSFSKSTLEKLIAGYGTDKALARLERQVGRSFRTTNQTFDRASEDLGGYLHADYRHYEGYYTLVRPSFDSPDRISLFPVKVDWDDTRPGLRISGETGGGYQKFAFLALPKGCPYMFIHANEKGWNSLMIFGTIDVADYMPGSLLTTGDLGGKIYAPFFLPVLLKKEENSSRKYKEILPTDVSFDGLKKRLDNVALQKFVRGTPKA